MGRGEEQLLEAVKLQEVPVVQKLIQRGRGKLLGSSKKVNINYQDKDGFSALHQAAVLGNTQLACLLLDANASVDLRDKNGLRPLHYCAWKGRIELVAALLGSGASCNLPAHNGSSPLHLAAQYGHAQVCKIMLQYGADISLRQSDGCSPLDLACEFGRTEVAELLLRGDDAIALLEQLQNSDVDCSTGCSPLHLAARNGHTGIIRFLLQSGVDINWRTSAGTCLHEAVGNEKTEIVQLLIDCGIDVTIRSGLGQTALELAQKLPKSPAIMDIIRKLSEVQPRFLQVFAINDFQNILDRNSLAFTKGALITVLEQNPNGNWRGRIDGSDGEPPTVGTFPASYVQPCRPGPSYRNLAGSDDSGIHPHDEDASTPWNAPHWGRASSKFHPTHNYINLDPRSSQPHQSKVPMPNPNVANPSYEDVICSQIDQPITKECVTRDRPITKPHVKAAPPITRPPPNQVSPRREVGIARSRPSISNPGYEDILTSTGSSGAPTSSAPTEQRRPPRPAISGRPNETSKNLPKRASHRTDMQSASPNDQVHHWLASFGMGQYAMNFAEHGYDLPTAVRASPSDLAAIRVLNPSHRKLIADRGSMMKHDPSTRLPFTQQLPRTVGEFLKSLSLEQYVPVFARNHVDTVEKLSLTTWEDLQEMGINQLGHQKKLMVAISNTIQIMKRTTPLPPVQPKPKPKISKPPASEPTSFGESPGLSSELQKALNKRQKIIDDAEVPPQVGAPPHPVPPPGNAFSNSAPPPATRPQVNMSSHSAPPPAARPQVNKSPHFSRPQVTAPPHSAPAPGMQTHASVPSHPTQVSPSYSQQYSFPQNGRVPPHTAPAENVTKQRRPSNSRGPPPSPPKRVSSMVMEDNFNVVTDHNQAHGSNVGNHPPSPHNAGGFTPGAGEHPPGVERPPVMPKTKPMVMKKPNKNIHTQVAVERQPPPMSPRGEVGGRFDLSALDGVGKQQRPSPGHSNQPTPHHDSGDEFEWPSPPPMQDPLPPPPQESSSLQYSSPPQTKSLPSQTPKPPSHFSSDHPPKDRQTPSPHHPMFSTSGNLSPRDGPQILPTTSHSPVTDRNTSVVNRQPTNSSGSLLPSNEQSAPPLPEKQGRVQPRTEILLDSPVPENPGATQQMLEDITSLFDGLAQEFDDFLS